MRIGEIIKNYRKENRYSMDAFAAKAGVSRQYIWILEKGKSSHAKSMPQPSLEMINKFASAMDMSSDDLFAQINQFTEIRKNASENGPEDNFVQVPLYALLGSASNIFVKDNILNYLTLPAQWLSEGKQYFGQQVHGDSMIGARIEEGDFLIFEMASAIESGKIGCFCIDDNLAICKRYFVSGTKIFLTSSNDNYAPIEVDSNEMKFKVVGKLVFVLQDRRK